MKRASSGGGRGRRAFGNEKGMKGTKGGHDWLKGVEDAWGWRGRAVETVARGTSDAHFCDFSGGGRRVRYFGAIVNVFSFFLISSVIDHNFSFVDLVFRDRVMVFLILESEDSK